MSPTAVLQIDDQLAEFDLDIRVDAGDPTPLDPRMVIIYSVDQCSVPPYCSPDSGIPLCQPSAWGGC